MLKKSKYNISFSVNSENYIYNSLSTAIIQVDNSLLDIIENEKFLELSESQIKDLKSNGLIIEDSIDETNEYLYYYDRWRYVERLSTLNFTIIPTYFCNLTCSYCSQGKHKINNDLTIMTLKEAEAIVKFLEKAINESKVKITFINIDFYGGEPLIAKEICYYISSNFNKIAKKYKIEINFSLTTNCVLFDQDVIDKFVKPYNAFVQITVDGIGIQHDLKRKNRNGDGTFNKTIEVIELLNQNGLKNNIVLRAHIDKDNIEQAESIIKFFKNKTNDFYFSLIKQFNGINDEIANQCINSIECNSIWEYKISKLILENGFDYKPSFGKKMPCSINSENSFFIDQYLNVYKCTSLISNRKFRCGYLSLDGDYSVDSMSFKMFNRTPKAFNKCLECITMPACASGCAAHAYFAKGTTSEFICDMPKDVLIDYLSNFIMLSNQGLID